MARLPQTALYAGNTVFVIVGGRLTARQVEIVGIAGQDVLVKGSIVQGEMVVTTRLTNAGEGLAVKGPQDPVNKQNLFHGLIRFFVHHPTASNLLMAGLVVLGLFGAVQLNTQFFPTIQVPSITVTVNWSGASAEDVEENILDAVEPALRFLDGVKEVRSVAREGLGVVTVEFDSAADMAKSLGDVKLAVDGVTTLPEDSEDPKITRIAFFESVAKLALSGPFSEQALKSQAKRLRDGLLAAGIDKVVLTGARDEEIWVRVRESELRRLDLTLGQVADRVRQETRDSPSGILEGRG